MTDPHAGLTEIDIVRSALAADYDVVSEIGRGGMAIVYRAVERELERDVALKVLPFSASADDETVARFLREARTAAGLEHPNVIPIYRVGRAGRVTYFAMKLAQGPSLGELLETRRTLPAHEVRRILVETASALGYAHARGVVHRDVKPDNILMDPDGRCLVTDFGIARVTRDARLTATGVSVGTPRYMSPEQARARPLDGRSDLYSLGIVAYECLAGHVPFDSPDPMAVLMDQVQTPPPRPALDDPEARELYRIVERLLAKEPEDRFESAEALLAALGERAPARRTSGANSSQRLRTGRAGTLSGSRPLAPLLTAARRLWRVRWARWSLVGIGALLAVLLLLPARHGTVASRCGTPGGAAARELRVLLLPVQPLRPGDPLPLRYELCGLGAQVPATVTVSLRPATRQPTGRRVAPLATQFGAWGAGKGATVGERTLRLPALTPGSYQLVVAARDVTGRRAQAAVPVTIRW